MTKSLPADLKGTLTLKTVPFKMKNLCKIKYCISHKTDNGNFWKKIFEDKINQACLQGGGRRAITMV